MKHFTHLFGVLVVSGTCAAAEISELHCTPLGAPGYWIESVHINVVYKKVIFITASGPNKRDLHDVNLLYIGPEQFGGHTYHFNWKVEGSEDSIVNVFKLFKTNEGWRLIDAGMETHGDQLVLKALGKSQSMQCK